MMPAARAIALRPVVADAAGESVHPRDRRPVSFRPDRSSLGPAGLALAALLALASGAAVAAETGDAPRARQVKPLWLGIVAASRPAEALERVEPFRLRIADTLGVDVHTRRFADERALIDAFAAGRIDYAPLSASGYAMAWRLCGCVEPLAVPRAGDGSPGWRAVVLVRTGSSIDSPAALAGKRLAVSGETSIGGRLMPLRLLEDQGLGGDQEPLLQTFEGPRAAVKALLAGEVDAAIAWSTLEGDLAEGYGRGTLHDMVADGELSMTDVRVMWSSSVLPHGPHTVRADLAEGPKRRLRDMLVDLDEVDPDAYEAIEPVHSGGFLRIGHAAYAPFVDLVTPRDPPRSGPGTTGSTLPPG